MTVIATLKEVKDNENRVGLTPKGAKELISKGHKVIVQKNAGNGAGFCDKKYEDAGAELMDNAEEIAEKADIVVKVKEPVQEEFSWLRKFKGKTLFTYLHLSGVDPDLTKELINNNITAIAYETVEDKEGMLPLLKPMSEVAGVLAVKYGGQYLQKKYDGRGITLCHIHNTDRGHVVVIGGGIVGSKAGVTAAGMGAEVTILESRPDKIDVLKEHYMDILSPRMYSHVSFVESTPENLKKYVEKADLLVGAVLVKGAEAPRIVTEEMVKSMRKGSVVVDVAIDQGGCVWGAKPTKHSDPIYKLDDKIFCCITNMPGQVPMQSTQALTGATFPYLLKMADMGVLEALKSDPGFMQGVNVSGGKIRYKAVAEDLEMMDAYEELKLQ